MNIWLRTFCLSQYKVVFVLIFPLTKRISFEKKFIFWSPILLIVLLCFWLLSGMFYSPNFRLFVHCLPLLSWSYFETYKYIDFDWFNSSVANNVYMFQIKKVSARSCEGGHRCTPPKECCAQGCCYLYAPPSAPKAPQPNNTSHVLNLFFINHWFFW